MDSITNTEEYKDFELRHNRQLNMLQDNVSFVFRATSCRIVTFVGKL
jgi:hypothetical protein